MKTILRKIIVSFLLSLAISGNLVFASSDYKAPSIPKPTLLPGPTAEQVETDGGRKILTESLIPKFTISFISFIGGVALLFVVIGGVRYTMVYGNEEAAEKAKNQIIWAIVGFLVSILAYTIVTVINNLEYSGNTSTGAAVGPTSEQATN